ncbi:MAG TPA: hypothetical protein VFH73_08260 [Polyangia bacterium]|jgi:hypothetical protein|nr:hypothetical protein [Polyangia bacterium]
MRIRQRPWLSLPALLFVLPFVLPFGRPASAETYAEASASVGVGATDNALSATTSSQEAATGRDEFTLIRVGGRVFRVLRAVQNDLAYAFTASRYLDHTAANGLSHGLTWTSIIALTSATQLRLSLGATYSHLNSTNPAAMNLALGPGAIPAGPISYFAATFQESLTYRPKATQLGTQSLSVATFVPLTDAQVSAIVAQHLLRGEATRGLNTGTGEFSLGLTWNPGKDDSLGQEIVPANRFVFGQVLAGARRELSLAWSVSGEVGGLAAMRVEGGPIDVGPAWRAGLRYRREFGQASLELARTPQPNVFLGDTLIVDLVSLRVGLPLDRRDRFFLLGIATYQHGRLVTRPSITGPFHPGLDVWSAVGAIGFRPTEIPMAVSLDYSYFNQKGGDLGFGGTLPPVQRQVVMLTVTGILRDSRPRQLPVAD